MGYESLDKQIENEFKRFLEVECNIPLSKYKLFEFYFRQLVIKHGGYEYEYDSLREDVLENTDFASREKQISEYISSWEKETSSSYGFSKVKVNETKTHAFYVEEYNEILDDLFYSDKEYRKDIITNDLKEAWIKNLQDKLDFILSHKGSQGRGYLKFDKNSFAIIENTQFDYYSKYIYYAKSVFGELFQLADSANDVKKSKLNEFLSRKICIEHDNDSINSLFTKETINNRLKNNKKKVKEISTYLKTEFRIDKRYIRYLQDNLFD